MTIAPLITVIVCTYRRYGLLRGCLRSLLEQTIDPADRDIIVVDNSGIDGGGEDFGWPSGIRRALCDNAGLSRARNVGVAMARGGIIAFIDDDALADSNWLASIAAAFASKPSMGVVGGPVAPIWPSARPDWLDEWHEGFLTIIDRGDRSRVLDHDWEWLAGTNIGFRASALRDAGPFPEHLGRMAEVLLGNEEIAVIAGIRAAGYSVHYDPGIIVRHHIHPERTSQSWMRRRVAWQAISDVMMYSDQQRHLCGESTMAMLWPHVSGYLEKLPPAHRGFSGLLRDEADPKMSAAQCRAISAMVSILALHGTSLETSLLELG